LHYLATNALYEEEREPFASYGYLCSYLADSYHPDDGGATFLRNIGSYKSYKA
jgi:hypothetical protein